jgi:hypothetical protein
MTEWPAPIVRLLLGQSTLAGALAEAQQEADAVARKSKVCQVEFYEGELALMRGDKSAAAARFEGALGDCSHQLAEWAAAKLELASLPGETTAGTKPTLEPIGGTSPASSPAATVPPARPSDTPSPAAFTKTVEMLFWEKAAHSNSLGDFQAGLNDHPKGTFAGLTRHHHRSDAEYRGQTVTPASSPA